VMHRIRARRAAVRAAAHDRKRLVNAADWAITTARQRWDLGTTPERVTVEDVRARAIEDFGLEVTPAAAAAVLRERLELRGAFGLQTDAFDAGGP
jgi:hypothetical protein